MKYRTSVLKLLLFIFLLPFAKSQINNVVATINSPVNMASTKGSWNGRLFCKDGGWANSFQVYSDCSWFGLEIIRFFCNSMQGNYISSIDYALDISYYTGTWSPVKSCSSMGYIIGYKTFGCCCGYHANDLSLNDITFICSTGEMITAGVTCNDGHYNGWSSLTLCPSGTAACGFDYKFDNSLTDNTALNDFEMICCRVCNSKSAVYYDMTTICNFCSISCLTCRSDSNTCESCGASDSLVGSVCIQTTNLFKISEEFTGASSTFSSEFSSGGWSTTIFLIGTCANSINTWSYLGNYGDSTISKTVTNLLPHYKIRLKTRFYKIDDWKGESISIKINGVSLPVARLASLGNDDDFYYGNVCQGTGNENTFFIDEETYHTATTITIQYSAAPTFGQYWGFSHVGVYIYRCDSTCFTCSGPNANECNSCYAFSRLSNSNTCKCDDGYYPVVTTNCISLPCTVCNLCFVGCLTCISDSATSCLSCKIDNYFYANQCLAVCPTSPSLFGDKVTLTCVTSCLSREFFDTNRVCQTCDSTCLTCVGTALACTSCTGTRYLEGNTCTKLCSLGLFGVASSHECLSDCEDYFFQHDVDRLCYLICPSGFYGNVFTKKCVASCPDGMYNDPLTIRCEYCDFNCLTCSGSTKNCLICKYSWLVGFFCNSPSFTNSLDSDVFIINPMTNLDITSLGFTINNSFTSNYANDCSPYYIIGGPGTFGSSSSIQKSYNSIPAHFRVRITFFFLKIDNWNNNKLIVTVDGVSIPTNLLFSSNMDSTVRKLCGTTSIPEALRPVDLIFSHNSSNLDLIITTDLTAAASQASWGIYKLSLTFDKCSLYCKTCQSFSSYDCLSCIPGLILQNNSGPSTCQSICPDGFYSDIITNTCSACNLLCSKCLGPSSNECITCPTGTLLLFAGSTSQCVSKCPNTHFENSDRVCQLCDSKCKTCFGTYSNCLTCSLPDYFIDNNCVSICPGNYFGDNSTATCVKNCPKPNFPYAVTKICVPCYNDCLECIGFGSNECTLCNSNKMFEEGSCVSSCSANHFLNVANSSCEVCTSNCEICSSLTTCSSCSNPFYKVTPANVSCSTCNGIGEAKGDLEKICVICVTKCLICDSLSTCQKCMEGYFLLNPSKCIPQKQIHANLETTFNPSIFNLIFNQAWSTFFEKIKDFLIIEITNVDKKDYNFIASVDRTGVTVKLTFEFNSIIKDDDIMNLTINYTDSPNDEYVLTNKIFTISMIPFCLLPTTYLISANACVMINYITPILKAQSSTEIQLKFKENYGDLYKNYSYLSNLTISLVNASFYDYIISTTDDPDVFNIILNFSTSLTVNPILTLYLNPPDIVLFNNSNTNKLTSYKLQASLFNYYYLDEATKSALAATTSTTTSLNSAASNAFSANNIMMGSSFGIKSLVSIDIIRFLRYFTVDYPPSVIAIYETSMPNSFIFPVVNLDEEDADGKIPDIFLKYDLYSYAFNNNGNILIETFVYFLLGALILLIIRITHRIKNRYFRVFLIILRLIFVWNYCLSSFLSQIMPFSLAAFLGLRYPTKATHIGYFNYIFAILCVIFIFAGFIIFFFLIRKLKPNLQEKFLQEQNTKLNSPNVNDQADLLKNDIKNTAIFQEPEEALSKTSNKIKNDIPKQISGGVSINYSINEGDSPTERAVLKQTKMNTYKKSDLEKSIKLIELNSPTSMLNDNTGISIKNNENEISFDMPLQKESSFSKKENIKVKDIYLNKDVIAEKILEEVFSSKETSPLAIRNTPNTWYRRIKTQINTLITKINRPESKFDWRSDDLEDFEQTMELLNRNFSPLHKDFKHSRTIQSYYFLFDMGRQVLLSFLVSFLHDHPFQGLILVNIVNLLFFAFLLCINPFKDKIDVVQNILNEICLLLSSFSALVLACMEKFNLVNMDFKLLLGWFMVGTNTLLILVFLLRMLFNFILIFYAVAKTVLKAISRKIRKRSQIIAEKIDDQDATKNKEDQSALQQIIELQNFFK